MQIRQCSKAGVGFFIIVAPHRRILQYIKLRKKQFWLSDLLRLEPVGSIRLVYEDKKNTADFINDFIFGFINFSLWQGL